MQTKYFTCDGETDKKNESFRDEMQQRQMPFRFSKCPKCWKNNYYFECNAPRLLKLKTQLQTEATPFNRFNRYLILFSFLSFFAENDSLDNEPFHVELA